MLKELCDKFYQVKISVQHWRDDERESRGRSELRDMKARNQESSLLDMIACVYNFGVIGLFWHWIQHVIDPSQYWQDVHFCILLNDVEYIEPDVLQIPDVFGVPPRFLESSNLSVLVQIISQF